MMSGRIFSLILLSILLIPTDAVVAQRPGSRMTLPTRNVLSRYGLERAWWSQATLDPSRDKIRHLVADEDIVFVQSRMGIVTAFDAHNGQKLWAVQIGRTNSPNFPLTTNNDTAIIIAGTLMTAVEKYTGKLLWKINIPSAPSTSAALDDRQVYVGCRDGSIYAFDLRKIRELHEKNLLPQWSAQTVNWRFKAFKSIITPPLTTGRVVNFASKGKSLYSVSAKDRKLVFQFELDYQASAPMAYIRGKMDKKTNHFKRYLFMPSEDLKLYSLNMDNGRVRWVYVAGLAIRKAPRVVEKDVYITPVRGGLHCLEESTGRLKWKRDEIATFLAATPSLVYTSDRLGNILLLARKDGAVTGVLPLRGFSVRISNSRTDRLFIATTSGLVVCIREQGQDFPLYYQFPDRRPILPELTKD